MKKTLVVLAALAAATSFAAAKELKQDSKQQPPTISATQMSDAEMDKVTAGDVVLGVSAADLSRPVGSGGQSVHREPSNGFHHSGGRGACFVSGQTPC